MILHVVIGTIVATLASCEVWLAYAGKQDDRSGSDLANRVIYYSRPRQRARAPTDDPPEHAVASPLISQGLLELLKRPCDV